MPMCKNKIEKEKKDEKKDENKAKMPKSTEDRCAVCGQQKPRRKKRYFLIGIILIILAYFIKIGYEKAFEKTIIMRFIEGLLNSKTVLNLNLSSTTKAKILYFAEITSFTPDEKVEEMPGMVAHNNGLTGKHPIVIIPGIANTSLELWQAKKENTSFFRKRIWGSHSTLVFMLHNRDEWVNIMKLNSDTGLDPVGIKVRACSSLDSSDFSIPGMWFWWKIVENLSYIGYDVADIHFAAFDWRLGIEELEIRDNYFTKLKIDIETQYIRKKEKVLVVAHSMGSLIFHYFMQWVSEKDPKWVDKYVHSSVYIGPPLLGAPKALGGLLAGEVKDTVDMGVIQYTIVELLFGKKNRHELFKTWGSLLHLLPKGGERIWKRKDSDKLDLVAVRKESKKERIKERKKNCIKEHKFLSYSDIFSIIKEILPSYNKQLHEKIVIPKKKQDKWSNPLECALPNAPNLTIYSLYGVNKSTESGYYFIDANGTLKIDRNISSRSNNVYNGVVLKDGDGTVPVVSLGYMGISGWKKKSLNPYGVKTVNREYKHVPSTSILEVRGGKYTAEHVNILGNIDLIRDILEISSGKTLPNKILSNLQEIADEIDKKTI
ncbi:phospholipid:diacylglycerol acyltransferase [Nematocida parisii]|nr:phospholipid:diacylglycerol acyltransferase [Nematocida parisii]